MCMSEQGASNAELRRQFYEACEAVKEFFRRPEAARADAKAELVELRQRRRAADAALATADHKQRFAHVDGRTLEDIVRDAGGTVL